MVINRKEYGLIVALIAIKLLVSLPFINSHSIDLDEPFSIFHSQKPLNELFLLFKNENNPPLHFILLNYWENLFGTGPIAVRSLSLLFSVLTVPVIFLLVKKVSNTTSGLFAVLLFIFSDFNHYHGLEARTYSLLVFEIALLLLLLIRIFNNNYSTLKNYFLLAALNALIFYTHYIFPVVLVAQFAVAAVFFKKIDLKKLSISAITFVLLISPWITVFIERSSSVNESGTWVPEPQYSEIYGLINKFLNDKWVMLALIIVAAGVILIHRKIVFEKIKRQKTPAKLLFVFTFVTYFMSFGLSKFSGVSIFLDRYLFFLSIPIFILLVLFFNSFGRIGTVALLVFFTVYLIRFDIVLDNNRETNKMAEIVKSSYTHKIIIAPDYFDLTFVYHYSPELFKTPASREQWSNSGIYTFNEKLDIEKLLLQNDKIWVADADLAFTQPENGLHDRFKSQFKVERSIRLKGNYTLTLYSKVDQ